MAVELTGREILGYRLEKCIGEGGMASVWKAQHAALAKTAAVKVLDPMLARDPSLVERFRGEAEIQHRLRHPNIVAVENFSFDPLCIVMEYIEGRPLSDLIPKQGLPFRQVIHVFRQVLAAAGYAHSQPEPVIHRDMKPSNILVTADGQVKVMDFGIAKVIGASKMTRTGTSMGTAAYMSPEQIKGAKDVDARSDLYSIGVALYEALAGRTPFEGDEGTDSDFLVRLAHIEKPVPDPRQFNPSIPEPLVHVVARAMAKEPAERFQSAADFLQAMEAVEPGAALAPLPVVPPVAPEHRTPPPSAPAGAPSTVAPTMAPTRSSGRKVAIFVAAFFAVALAVALIVTSTGGGEEEEAPSPVVVTEVAPATPDAPAPSPSPVVVPSDPVPSPAPAPTPAAPACPAAKDRRPVPRESGAMVSIPGGEFYMGMDDPAVDAMVSLCMRDQAETRCSASIFEDQTPVHSVYVSSFYMDRYEASNGEYARCVASGYCAASRFANHSELGRAERPVTGVTHDNAVAYCQWVGKRLPTESEWEWAARYPDGRRYPWGNEPPTPAHARYCDDEACALEFFSEPSQAYRDYPTTSISASMAGQSALGIFHMAGNVAEWVAEPYKGNAYSLCAKGRCPMPGESGRRFAAKGGSFDASSVMLDASYRQAHAQGAKSAGLGIRCAAGGAWGGRPSGNMVAVPSGQMQRGLSVEEVEQRVAECLPSPSMLQCEQGARFSDQSPKHRVYVDPFEMDRYEVTRAEYANCVAAGVCELAKGYDHQAGLPSEVPVTGVSQLDAIAYCEWQGKRLPTEAEWARAARGSTGRLWPWGDAPPDACDANLCVGACASLARSAREDSPDFTLAPVGAYPKDRTPEGVFDLAGNVKEWTADAYEKKAYEKCAKAGICRNPKYPKTKKGCVTRGGHFERGATRGVTYRSGPLKRDYRASVLGFRCVR